MDLNHLHLHVADVDRSRSFYEDHFGFREKARHGRILFLTNERGFDLALAPDDATEPFPPWFHFGFRVPEAETVRKMYGEMRSAGVEIKGDLIDDLGYVTFRCFDPDGYGIEVYWE